MRSSGTRKLLVPALGLAALALPPWSAYLTATLPGEHVARHWDLAWTGFDLLEALALGATVLALLRGSRFLPLFAASAGAGLLADAWFDLVTSSPGDELRWALGLALLAELPLAALCFWLAYSAVAVSGGRELASGAGPRPTARRGRPAAARGSARREGSGAPSGGRTSR